MFEIFRLNGIREMTSDLVKEGEYVCAEDTLFIVVNTCWLACEYTESCMCLSICRLFYLNKIATPPIFLK